jgi:hypothetical protein
VENGGSSENTISKISRLGRASLKNLGWFTLIFLGSAAGFFSGAVVGISICKKFHVPKSFLLALIVRVSMMAGSALGTVGVCGLLKKRVQTSVLPNACSHSENRGSVESTISKISRLGRTTLKILGRGALIFFGATVGGISGPVFMSIPVSLVSVFKEIPECLWPYIEYVSQVAGSALGTVGTCRVLKKCHTL